MVPKKKGATIQPLKRGATPQVQLGAVFRPIPMERPMKVYPVHGSDIISLSLLNTLVTGLWSGASALIFLGIGIIIDLAVGGQFTAGQLTESGRVLLICVAPLCGVLGLASFIAGWIVRGKRESIWDKIERESTEVIP